MKPNERILAEINFAFNRIGSINSLKSEMRTLAAMNISWSDILYVAAGRGYSFYNNLVVLRDNGII
jgi:hypothetical protein